MPVTNKPAAGRAGRPSREAAQAIDGRLLDAAESLLMEHGFGGASVAAIAALAGASKQTIYSRYPTKERLFEAVIERAVERFLEGLDREVRGRTVESRIRNLALLLIDRMLDPQSLRLMRALIAGVDRFTEVAKSIDRDAQRRVEQFIVDTGELDAIVDEARGSLKRAVAARQLIDLTVNPLLLRALLGADVAMLLREAPAMVKTNVALFLRGFGG